MMKLFKTINFYNPSKKSYAILILLMFVILGCAKTEESKIKDTCNRFIKGKIALSKGDSSELKLVTEDSLFKLIMLNRQYDQTLNVPTIRPDLNIRAKSVEINDSCASCLMSGMEDYKIKLCKIGETWKIKGENDIYPTPERLARVKQKLIDYKLFLKQKPARDSVLNVVNSFFQYTNLYFKNQELDSLKKVCNDESLKFMQRFYTYAKKRSGLDLLIAEMNKPQGLAGDVIFENNNVIFRFYNEPNAVSIQKLNGSYVVTGFNGTDSKYITDNKMNEQYIDLLRSLKLIQPDIMRNKDIIR